MRPEIILIIFLLFIAGLWFLIETKRSQKRFFVILAIVLIAGTYFGFYTSIKGHSLDLGTYEGIKNAIGLYFSWMGNIFNNFGAITSNAVKMDWAFDGPLEDVNTSESKNGS